MKTVQHAFGFSDKSDWAWPDDDVKLLQVIDDVMGIDLIMRHVNDRTDPSHGGKTWSADTVIQAGGACGVWPYRLSQLFQHTITFEPLKDNWEALMENCRGRPIDAFNGVLGSGDEPFGMVGMKQHPREEHNAGSQQVELGVMGPDATKKIGTTYPVYTIDKVMSHFPDDKQVDAIILDLEGYEIMALQGARETIERCHPVICVEDKGLSEKFGHRKGSVIQMLAAEHGYVIAERMKRDVILVAL